MNQEKIGKFIAQCRKEKNLTQSQLAEKLNMSDKSISKWETGRGMPDSSIMMELCTYLGINVNELLSGEHIKDEEYQKKANENILSIVRVSDKNKKIKNRTILLFIVSILFFLIVALFYIVYNNIKLNVNYDSRLIECTINNDNIICNFNGSSLVTFDYFSLNNNEQTLIFINGKILLLNKIRSHFETWDSMAQLNNGEKAHFSSKLILDKNKDIVDCKEKIRVYYTNTSINKIKNANDKDLEKVIKSANFIAEQ